MDVLGFVKIALGKQTQQSTNSRRQQWKILWRGLTAWLVMTMRPFPKTTKTGPLPKKTVALPMTR